jgi:glycine hydroxymethyltransferase
MTPAFQEYAAQIITNAKALAEELTRLGYTLVTGGTDNHLVLVDLKPQKVLGSKVQVLCDFARITLNKNTVPGDASAMNPGGVRIGSPAMTSRGAQAHHFVQIAQFFDEAVKLAIQVQAESGPKLVDFTPRAKENPQVAELRSRVFEFSKQFPIPGFDSTGLTAD